MNASPAEPHTRRATRRRPPLLLAAPLFLAVQALLPAPARAQAADVKYETGLSILHSDNIGLTETNPRDDTVISPFLRFEADHESSSLRLKARGRAEYLHYTGNSYDDEWRGELSAQLNWSILPERVELVVSDWLIRAPVDVFTNFVPTNQQEVNVFQAGPSFFARFNATTHGQLDLRYVNTQAEETRDFNGDRFKAAARLMREFTPTASGSLNIDVARVQFDRNSGSTDFTRYGAYVGLARQLASFDLEADLGMAWVRRDGFNGASAPTVRLRVDWRVAPRSVLSAAADYELGDAAQYAAVDLEDTIRPILDGLTDADLAAGPSLFRNRQFELYYRYSGDRLSVQVHPRYQVFRYLEDTVQNQAVSGGVVEIGYLLRRNMTLAFSAERVNRRFETIDRSDHDTRFLFSLIDEFARNWAWRLDLEHNRRDSSTAGFSHDVNAVALTIAYRR
ncbi:MAG: hypothetical protein EOP93_06020 [Lysobacteraceae bacterium]|nr:MAG: hypothetical protein EOP93_06020 [Xanthomonadaceae bacterium]